ncbi:hypothetical protein, partial [Micromonospora sagamiensis]
MLPGWLSAPLGRGAAGLVRALWWTLVLVGRGLRLDGVLLWHGAVALGRAGLVLGRGLGRGLRRFRGVAA